MDEPGGDSNNKGATKKLKSKKNRAIFYNFRCLSS